MAIEQSGKLQKLKSSTKEHTKKPNLPLKPETYKTISFKKTTICILWSIKT